MALKTELNVQTSRLSPKALVEYKPELAAFLLLLAGLIWATIYAFRTEERTHTMIAAIIQLVVGAVLLGCVVWLKLNDVDEVLDLATPRSKLKRWRKALITIVLSLLGTATILDPLIPGIANLTVRIPIGRAAYRGLPEHLRVKVVPLGLGGLAGGDRTLDSHFGGDGSVQIEVSLAVLETHVVLELYDETSPSVIIESHTVYVSPFVRRQLIGQTFTFSN